MQLVLFDIDGTLLHGHGVGSRAMENTGRALVGPRFSLATVDFAGALDPWIYAEAARIMGIADPETMHERFREAYLIELAREIARADPPPAILPGVAEALAALRSHAGVTLGLMTGNYRNAAPLKLRAVGIDPTQFTIGAFGDDASTRPELVPVALERWKRAGVEAKAERVVVVGDTPRDVDCARRNGCRCLAVATGKHSMEILEQAGADAVVRDLTDLRPLLQMLAAIQP